MVAGSFSVQVESPVEAKRLWNALVVDGHNFIPKQASNILSLTILQGDGGVGTIRQVNSSANKDFSYLKERVEEFDEEKYVFSYSHLEGGQLGKTLASAKHEVKYSPKEGGGCVWTSTYYYDTLPGISPDQSKLQELNDLGTALFKKIEAYLLANPTLYC